MKNHQNRQNALVKKDTAIEKLLKGSKVIKPHSID